MSYLTGLKDPIIYWQYKNSPAIVTILQGMTALFKKYYPCEIWEILQLDTATGYALDVIGQRLGYPRPKEIPEAVGRYDISRYAQAYYDMSLDELALVQDDTYRYMLKLRVMMWQPWRPISITSMYKALDFAFPGVQFKLAPRKGQKVMDLYILSYIDYPQRRALFSDAIKAPLGQTLIVTDAYDTVQYLSADGSEENLMGDGAGANIIAYL